MTVVPPHDALLSASFMQQARPEAATCQWASPVARHCAATNQAEVVPAAPMTSVNAPATPCLQLSLLRTAVVSGLFC